jgi:adenosylmethionine-8-amino-7-oxononanoate aminotransferase
MSKHIWYPFTQMKTQLPPVTMHRGKGLYLYDEHGNGYMDLVSSWWVNIHGHSHPKIAQAIGTQAATLEHVLLADFNHPAALTFSRKLCDVLDPSLSHIFFSDNGSTAVEVSLKMAIQYWRNENQPQRNRFLSFNGAYHGDTFGAMAMGKTSGFYGPFMDYLFATDSLPLPTTWWEDADVEDKETQALAALKAHLEQHGHETIAMLIEPLMQGATGMHMHRPVFLEKAIQLCRAYGILIIFDEVMTGFGRLGKMFAYEHLEARPDIICLAKGITGGFLPMAVTVCNDQIYEAFLSDAITKTFVHGHSYTANPLGCAAGIASLEVFEEEHTLNKIQTIEAAHKRLALALLETGLITKLRLYGTIAAFEPKLEAPYGSDASLHMRKLFLDKGLILRPLGNVIYILPPYCITEEELTRSYVGIREVLEAGQAQQTMGFFP